MGYQNIYFRRNLACTELNPPSASLHSELTRCERRKGKVDQKSIKRQQIFRELAGISTDFFNAYHQGHLLCLFPAIQ